VNRCTEETLFNFLPAYRYEPRQDYPARSICLLVDE
jgi:hypothetical protein